MRERFVAEQLGDLREIGLDWDGEVVRQSERTALYADALERLGADGLVYRCFCSRREVREAASAQHGKAPEGFYPGTCAVLAEEESQRRAEAGEEFALRLRAGRREVTITDRLHGERTDPVDDLVLRRRDGAFAYNLAVVVDDAEQGVGEVVRGDDLLPSTAGQALLCDLLGLERPAWAHVPLVLGPDGSRLAKRHGAVTLRDVGAAVARRWMAESLGWSGSGEPADLLGTFDPHDVPNVPTVLDPERL